MGNCNERNLSIEFINKIKNNKNIMDCLKEIENKKLFVGIRNNYFNIYYKGASVAKIEIKNINKGNEKIEGKTSKKYLSMDNGENSKKNDDYITKQVDEIDFDEVIKGIDRYLEKNKSENLEKECQQNLIISNNSLESSSEWYCIDMEYIMEREIDENTVKASKLANYGRFDIIAVSKKRAPESGKYKVALVELKVGTGSFSGTSVYFDNLIKEVGLKKGILNVNNSINIGSGILGHFSDYVRYLEEPARYDKLRKEICNILKNYQELEFLPECYNAIEDINEQDFEPEPLIVFLTYSGENKSVENVKNSFKRYIFNKKVLGYGCSKYNVQDMWDDKGQEYIPKFKYVFREGVCNSNIKNPIFCDLNISESIKLED